MTGPHEADQRDRSSESRTGPGGSSAGESRDVFGQEELARTMARFDVGRAQSARPLERGSLRSPKLVVRTERGVFLLKRRDVAAIDPDRVAFAHAVQLHLLEKRFPLPRLHATSDTGETALRAGGFLYELFDFVQGDAFDASRAKAEAAGRELAVFHRAMREFHAQRTPPGGGFHRSRRCVANLSRIARDDADAESRRLASALREAYLDAADAADAVGVSRWPRQIIHADWHPGNLVFSGDDVAAVVDYDSVREDARAMDVAGGALHFSFSRQTEDPEAWSDALDTGRFSAFCRGYHGLEGARVSDAELEVLAWLMIESLISETAAPIAATGRFGRLQGAAFLRMIGRKVAWLQDHASDLTDLARGSPPHAGG